jgi:ribosomal protein S12 methylthiotransferase
VLIFSLYEGSRAAKMDHQVPTRTKNRRYREAMKLQQRIAREMAESRTGQTLRVLVETPNAGRTEHDAPEVDCRVILTQPAEVGTFINAKILGAQTYDLVAEPI